MPLSVTVASIFAQGNPSTDVNRYFLMSKLFGHKFYKVQYVGYLPDHAAKSWELGSNAET